MFNDRQQKQRRKEHAQATKKAKKYANRSKIWKQLVIWMTLKVHVGSSRQTFALILKSDLREYGYKLPQGLVQQAKLAQFECAKEETRSV